jgi:hypothetical protein
LTDRSCPVTGAPAPDGSDGYDWERDAPDSWALAIEEKRRRMLAETSRRHDIPGNQAAAK